MEQCSKSKRHLLEILKIAMNIRYRVKSEN